MRFESGEFEARVLKKFYEIFMKKQCRKNTNDKVIQGCLLRGKPKLIVDSHIQYNWQSFWSPKHAILSPSDTN